jgi:hypothetical protein
MGHDGVLWTRLNRLRHRSGGRVFLDAQNLAGIILHRFSPPYEGAGAKIVGGKLIYPLTDRVVDKKDFRNNSKFAEGRHVEMVVEEYWNGVCCFVDGMLHEFYPR